MKTIYRSEDGKDFDTVEECVEHEGSKPMLFSEGGYETTDVENACYIYLKNSSSTQAYLNICESLNCQHDGIDASTTGLFFWDASSNVYQHLTSDTLRIAYGIMHEIDPENFE